MFLKRIIAILLKQKIFSNYVINFFSKRINIIHFNSISSNNLLILDKYRFGDNLDNLINYNKLNIFTLPVNLQDKLTFLSESNFKNIFVKKDINAIPSDIGLKYLDNILLEILKKRKIKYVLTAGAYYLRNTNWEKILNKSKIPIFCLHKESVGLSKKINFITNKNFYTKRRKFNGNILFVANHHMKDLLSEINYFPKEKIKVVGLPKIDNLYHLKNKYKNVADSESKNKIVLFSFYHTYLLEDISEEQGKWSEDGSFGFYNLFNSVHATVAKFAKNHPDKEVIIKLKWKSDYWERKINNALEKYNLNINEIPNLRIDHRTEAQLLINSCETVIAFNSTTLTESLFLNKKTIIPCYFEAKDKYSDYVLWSDNEAFIRAFSEKDLYNKISNSHKHFCPKGHITKTLEEAFGFIDGNNAKRLYDSINKYTQ